MWGPLSPTFQILLNLNDAVSEWLGIIKEKPTKKKDSILSLTKNCKNSSSEIFYTQLFYFVQELKERRTNFHHHYRTSFFFINFDQIHYNYTQTITNLFFLLKK